MKIFLFFIGLFFPFFVFANFDGNIYFSWLDKCVEYNSKEIPGSLWFTFTKNWDVYYIKEKNLYKNHSLLKIWIFRFMWLTSDWSILYSKKNNDGKEDIYENDTYITTFDRTWWVDPIKNSDSDFIELHEDGTYEIIPTKYALSWFIDEVAYDFIDGKFVPHWKQPFLRREYSNNKKHIWEIISYYRWDAQTSFYVINGKKSQLYDAVDFIKISDNWEYWFRVRNGNDYTFLLNGREVLSTKMDEFISEFHFINNQKVYNKIVKTDVWNRSFLVIWEKEMEYDTVYAIVEFPDKSWFYARVVKNGKDIWNINGEEYEKYDGLYYMAFNENWDRIFSWKKGKKDVLIKNDEEILTYDRISHPNFYDGDKIFFYAKNDEKYFFVKDWVESKHMKEYDYFIHNDDYSRYVFANFDIGKSVYCEDISKIINISENQREIIKKYFLKYAWYSLQQKNSVKKILREKYEKETNSVKKQILELFLKNINI